MMNTDLVERNTSASRNGLFCEDYTRSKFPELEWVGGLYDAVINGQPVDVKGCEAWYGRGDRASCRRAGRFTLDADQDVELKSKGGLYFFVIHFGELVVKSFFIPAVKIQFRRQLAWTTLQKLVEVM